MKPMLKSNKIGNIDIRSFSVPLQNVYVTLAFNDGVPMDMAVANVFEDAESNHMSFMATATVLDAALQQIAAEQKVGKAADVQALIDSLVPPDRSMMN